MIIFRADSRRRGKTFLLLGLTRENVKRLVGGDPILINRARHGKAIPEWLEVFVAFGNTEQDIKEKLQRIGLIDESTQTYKTDEYEREEAEAAAKSGEPPKAGKES